MKPLLVFTSFTYFAPTLAFWQYGLDLWDRFCPSRVPQFIRDLDHPYIKANYRKINGLDNPQEALCNPESLQRLNIPPVPEDLFANLFVDNNRAEITGRTGWQNANDRFKEILACSSAMETCKGLLVDIYIYRGGQYCTDRPFSLCPTEPAIPPMAIPELFAQVISAMPRLESLEWASSWEDEATALEFRRFFDDRNLLLPSLKTLALAPGFEFMLHHTPNVTRVTPSRGYGWQRYVSKTSGGSNMMESPSWKLINATKELDGLTHLELITRWSQEVIKDLYDAAPGLISLGIRGEILPDHRESGIYDMMTSIYEQATEFEEGELLGVRECAV
jgi:hypothetical protein